MSLGELLAALPSEVRLQIFCLALGHRTAGALLRHWLDLALDTTLEQQLITAGADRQQAMYSITAFQAASTGSSRHLLQDMAAMARKAVLTGSSRWRHLLQDVAAMVADAVEEMDGGSDPVAKNSAQDPTRDQGGSQYNGGGHKVGKRQGAASCCLGQVHVQQFFDIIEQHTDNIYVPGFGTYTFNLFKDWEQAKKQASQVLGVAQAKAYEAVEETKQCTADAATKGQEFAKHSKHKAHEVGEQATQKAHQAAAYTREKVEKLGEYGRAKAGEVAEEAMDMAEQAKQRTAEAVQYGKETVDQTADQAAAKTHELIHEGKEATDEAFARTKQTTQQALARDRTGQPGNVWSEWWTYRPQLRQACLTRRKTLSVGLPNGGVEMPCNDCQAGEEQAQYKASEVTERGKETAQETLASSQHSAHHVLPQGTCKLQDHVPVPVRRTPKGSTTRPRLCGRCPTSGLECTQNESSTTGQMPAGLRCQGGTGGTADSGMFSGPKSGTSIEEQSLKDNLPRGQGMQDATQQGFGTVSPDAGAPWGGASTDKLEGSHMQTGNSGSAAQPGLDQSTGSKGTNAGATGADIAHSGKAGAETASKAQGALQPGLDQS
eukprot:jgi/Astpho2/8223/Aster-01312